MMRPLAILQAEEIKRMLKDGKIFDLSTRDGLLYWLMFLRN